MHAIFLKLAGCFIRKTCLNFICLMLRSLLNKQQSLQDHHYGLFPFLCNQQQLDLASY